MASENQGKHLEFTFIGSLKAFLLWLAKWCKIHKVYINSYSMLLLLFTKSIYLFTFNNRIYIRDIYLFTFTGAPVFLIHNHMCSHLRDVFIHIQRVIFIDIHDRNIHSAFSAHHLCASFGPSSRSTISEHNMADRG